MRTRSALLAPALIAGFLLAPAAAQSNERGGPPTARAKTLAGPAASSAVPAAYRTYGVSCRGTGRAALTCAANNPAGGTLVSQTLRNEYAYGMTLPAPTVVLGCRLFTAVNTATTTVPVVSMTCGLYLSSTTTPSLPATATTTSGTMVVGTTPAFYECYFNPPVVVPANSNIWISQFESGQILAADLTSGSPPTLPTYWRRPAGGGGAWGVTGIIQFPSWQLICDGGPPNGNPLLTFHHQPVLGQSYDVLLAHGAPSRPAFLFFGASSTNWRGLTLPFPIGLLGATGCFINASGEIVVNVASSPAGTAAITIGVPNVPSINGLSVYNQWIIFDPPANNLGLVFSNGGQATFGT